ncbi:MAG: hypothetical protein PF447_08250 [Spirochaetaceae bacterium]|nr:hypothetical protein [Spirochaetaceae bacterium]
MKRIIGLLILILFFTGCRGKKDVEAPQENEINIDQPAASDENYPSREPRNNIS